MTQKINLPKHYNYIGVFLTLGCNLSCSYCINHLSGLFNKRKHLNGSQWVSILNRIDASSDLPLTLQGGEPSIHPDFLKILKGVKKDLKIDLLTNLQFDIESFSREISPERFERKSPYASIRVSYHPETMSLDDVLSKSKKLVERGYSLALYSVDHPKYTNEIAMAKEKAHQAGVIFKTKELLGMVDGQLHGNFKYPDAVYPQKLKSCECKTSELLISPEGKVFRCHHDLYNYKMPIADMTHEDFQIDDIFRPCHYYGNCNPCDIKVKNNRFQNFGHTSVNIKNIREREKTTLTQEAQV